MKNTINWFEIPAADFDRAVHFYNTIFSIQLRSETTIGVQNGIFPNRGEGAVNGAIVCGPNYEPSAKGSVVYLNADHQLDTILSRVESAGGKVLIPSTGTPFGSIAFILDTEGNKIGLHTEN